MRDKSKSLNVISEPVPEKEMEDGYVLSDDELENIVGGLDVNPNIHLPVNPIVAPIINPYRRN